MVHYYSLSGLAVTILTIIFGVMNLKPCLFGPQTSRLRQEEGFHIGIDRTERYQLTMQRWLVLSPKCVKG